MELSKKPTKKQPFRLTYEGFGTADQYIDKLESLLVTPINMVLECHDLYMSDIGKLEEVFWLLKNRKEGK